MRYLLFFPQYIRKVAFINQSCPCSPYYQVESLPSPNFTYAQRSMLKAGLIPHSLWFFSPYTSLPLRNSCHLYLYRIRFCSLYIFPGLSNTFLIQIYTTMFYFDMLRLFSSTLHPLPCLLTIHIYNQRHSTFFAHLKYASVSPGHICCPVLLRIKCSLLYSFASIKRAICVHACLSLHQRKIREKKLQLSRQSDRFVECIAGWSSWCVKKPFAVFKKREIC